MIVLRRYFIVKMFASSNRKNARQYDHALNNLANVAKKETYSPPKAKEVILPKSPSDSSIMSSPSSNNNIIDFNKARSEYRMANAKKINPEYGLSLTSTPSGYVGGGNTVKGGSYVSTGTSLPSIGNGNIVTTSNSSNLQYNGNSTQSPSIKSSNSTVRDNKVSYVLPKVAEEKPLTYEANISSPTSLTSPNSNSTTPQKEPSAGGAGGSSNVTQQTTTGSTGGGSGRTGSTTKSNNTNTTKATAGTKSTGKIWKGVGIGAGLTAAGLLAYNHFKNKNE